MAKKPALNAMGTQAPQSPTITTFGIQNFRVPFSNVIPLTISSKARQWFLVVLSLVIYANTAWNEYAVDDAMVILKNGYVKKGFSGIGDILKNDTERAWKETVAEMEVKKEKDKFSYWRPLSVVTFAIEYGLWKNTPAISHIINAMLYAGVVGLLFHLLSTFWFRNWPDLAFFSALLFAVHPIHTEVVANIKGRDELLALLFLLLTCWFVFQAVANNLAIKRLVFAALSFFLALMAKENGLVFLVIIPLSVYFFSNASFSSILKIAGVLFGVILIYILVRLKITGFGFQSEHNDILYNRYAQSGFEEKYSTIIAVLLTYLRMLIWPNPMSWDYTYAHIPFFNFGSPEFITSLILYVCLAGFAFLKLKTKNIFSFAILFYLGCLFIISNLVVDIGGYVGERFVFQASIGFTIAIAVLMLLLADLFKNLKVSFILVFFGLITVLGSYQTISRNFDWKNNETLFLKDVETAPNSAKAQAAAGEIYAKRAEKIKAKADSLLYANKIDAIYDTLKKAYFAEFNKATSYYQKATSIYPHYFDALLNLGEVKFLQDSLDRCQYYWRKCLKITPNHHKLVKHRIVIGVHLYWRGKAYANAGRFDEAQTYLKDAVFWDATSDSAWYMLGMTYAMKNELNRAAQCLDTATILRPNLMHYWHDLMVAAGKAQNAVLAKKAATKLLAIDPKSEAAKTTLQYYESFR